MCGTRVKRDRRSSKRASLREEEAGHDSRGKQSVAFG